MAVDTPTRCATCGDAATTSCTGCKDAPEYDLHDAISVVYCSHACQKTDWPRHKDHCRTLQHRKKLYRAARLLKEALLTYRTILYDLHLNEVELKDGTLWLHQKPSRRPMRGPFPEHATSNPNHREAALAANQCTASMALLGRMTRKLLADVPSTLEVIDLHMGAPITRARLTPGPDPRNVPHTLIRATTLHSKEVWLIDSTGCQYGFSEVLVPYDTYYQEKGCKVVIPPTPYDATETKDLDFYKTIPTMNATEIQRENAEQERKDRLHFAAFVDTRVTKDVLEGTREVFEKAVGQFVADLKLHMLKIAPQV
ncbi:hypothetical protein B0T11DRAFT_129179 [Plectosphaerella cucumerina]|uniref:MYND-type domain-containing protein n=1 Tax=Plectosphaerella cucumerina TaxID=40658 RepID=A0A8K0WYC0_9PEZI|nr:hypothetical protein B0T11DRAFT_129179 [Plectosphaerella cucumerina]